MINHTKEYRRQTGEAVHTLELYGLTPKLEINALPLKVNGDERFVIHAILERYSPRREGLADGAAVHNPIDDFDPKVGVLLASARAYSDYAKRLKGEAYRLMMKNAEAQKIRIQTLRIAKGAHRLRKGPDVLIEKAEAHRIRLRKALEEGRVFYCPECKGHFANNGKVAQNCPHCKEGHARKYWHSHRLDEFKDEKEAADGEEGTVPGDPLP